MTKKFRAVISEFTVTTTLGLELSCDTCGENLEVALENHTQNQLVGYVKPCSQCISNAQSDAYERGYSDAVDDTNS